MNEATPAKLLKYWLGGRDRTSEWRNQNPTSSIASSRPRPTFVCSGHLRCEWPTRSGKRRLRWLVGRIRTFVWWKQYRGRTAPHRQGKRLRLDRLARSYFANERYKLACRCSALTCGTTDKLSTRSLSVTN